LESSKNEAFSKALFLDDSNLKVLNSFFYFAQTLRLFSEIWTMVIPRIVVMAKND
jgi:hypothetical protein